MSEPPGDTQLAAHGRRPAAVLVPIYDTPSGPTLILIRRTPLGLHSGQIAFPGGRPEPGDCSLEDTALREAEEELAIPRRIVRVIGRLPVVETIVSNYAIHPYVSRLSRRPAMRRQETEVAAILDVPLDVLRRPPDEEEWELPEPDGSGLRRRRVRFYPWGDDKIWGATQRIIQSLVEAIDSGSLRL